MKLYVTVEEFLYAKKIENQTERTLRGYKNALNLFANWLQREWTIDELEKIRVVHLKQYVAYHLKMGHKATYVNGIIKILRAFFKYTNGEDYTDIAYEKVAWVREEKPVIKAFSAQDARQLLEYYDNKSYLCTEILKITTIIINLSQNSGYYSHSYPRSLSGCCLISLYENLAAVGAHYPHFLGAADDGVTLGAYPPPGAALCLGRFVLAALFGCCGLRYSCSCKVCPVQPLDHLNILPALEDDEV